VRRVTVVPLLPQIRIGEPVGVSELKGPLAAAQNPILGPILASFADGVESSACSRRLGMWGDFYEERLRRNRDMSTALITNEAAAGSGAEMAEPKPEPLPAALPNFDRQKS
jgi:hypothetical protein